jgi:hypothetical protein
VRERETERETWSLTFREEHRLRLFENWLLRKILGPKKDEVTKEWRKQHNDELHDLCSLPNLVRVNQSSRDGRGKVLWGSREVPHGQTTQKT